MTVHKEFKKHLKEKELGFHRKQATKTLRSLNIFVTASRNLLTDWSELLDESGNLDIGANHYPQGWDSFDIEYDAIVKWAKAFKDQLRQVK